MSLPQACLPVQSRGHRRQRTDGNNGSQNGGLLDRAAFDDIASMDASSYLYMVVQQAKSLPEVFEASRSPIISKRRTENDDEPQMGSAASLAYLLSDRTALVPPPTALHLPVAASVWTERTLETFSRLRDYLEDCRLRGIGGKRTDRVLLPPMKDRAAWHIFCAGHAEAQGNAAAYYEDDTLAIVAAAENDNDCNDDEDTEDPGDGASAIPTATWQRNLPEKGFAPTVSLLLQMDQVMIRRVLGHLAYYIEEGWSPGPLSQWIYALLARLERPIHRDDAAMLYKFLRRLTHVRAALVLENDRERDVLARVNVLIAIVGVYLEQGGGYANVLSLH
jgi:survival of motor neuron protein-interacting protein 1